MIEETASYSNPVAFINLSAMISASINCLGPDFALNFISNIQTLTNIISNKVDIERKNAAILLATLSKNEECKEKMRETHALEVLMSLSAPLAK